MVRPAAAAAAADAAARCAAASTSTRAAARVPGSARSPLWSLTHRSSGRHSL